ncbi:RagB/SusD family nutrient uptake outer membrane protein [Zhouia spongiae]|uniref:RagB/SusD family nutrient uptake outer membrane protein n=1 Tax=Zhouia spongiae TaxID=2202721 RepID=A0ABY3YHZ2_9FLAO|nr:RagB/SusD family nutrient uptake outer membrane protein [Zhouia spongiae]UNY97484.1 RagB/SusD family nutrient uptake outer membrane protein [Zhouia spongiae]
MRKRIFLVLLLTALWSCDEYLDLIPDNVATLDDAFALRDTAEGYLFTCYSWIPRQGSVFNNPGMLSGGELWGVPSNSATGLSLAKGFQNIVNPLFNYWEGGNNAGDLYGGIRDCNIFLENVHKVPDIEESERSRWIAEVKFLKAFYHYWLMRSYGPIPVIRESLPIDVSPDDAKVPREPVEDVVNYIVELLDEAIGSLPEVIENPVNEAGRITKPIAAMLKAQVLTLGASPLFNGNTDYASMLNNEGTPLISQTYSEDKWKLAAQACKEAIEVAHSAGHSLYQFDPNSVPSSQAILSDTTITQMNIRNSITERWNSEIIWSNASSVLDQSVVTPRTWNPSRSHAGMEGAYAPPLAIAEMFYSDNGVPIEEDIEYDYQNRYDLKTAGEDDKYNIKKGYTTAALHFNRENRFYATLGFDGGIWYGQGRYEDDASNLFYIQGKLGQAAGVLVITDYSATGYWPKKLINYQNVIETNSYTQNWYPWPMMRLADLYLLYAEAENEANGPTTEAYEYINRVRNRAGLTSVQESWSNYSSSPNKYTTKEGLREIIHKERMIELALEGNRYWDVKRWKTAHVELNKAIQGWDVFQESEEGYYRVQNVFNPVFRQRDYLWPLSEDVLIRNNQLIQNTGW